MSRKMSMISVDVTSSFTSIDLNLVKDTLLQLFTTNGSQSGCLQTSSIVELMDLCSLTISQDNRKIFQHIKGTPIGPTASVFLSDTAMQRLESTVVPEIDLKLWAR